MFRAQAVCIHHCPRILENREGHIGVFVNASAQFLFRYYCVKLYGEREERVLCLLAHCETDAQEAVKGPGPVFA